MAVSVLDAWTTVDLTDPDGVQTISAGSGERLALLTWACETAGQVSFSQMEIGGVTPTGSVIRFWENGSADQHVYFWWWNEAAIASFADNDIDSQDGEALTKQKWSFVVFDGADQTNPVTTQSGTDTSTNALDISSTSTSDDYDVVAVSRASGNRSITDYDTLTEAWQENTDFTGACGAGAGGDSTITITGNGIAADMTWAHAIINASAGITPVNYDKGARGIMRGVGRGI